MAADLQPSCFGHSSRGPGTWGLLPMLWQASSPRLRRDVPPCPAALPGPSSVSGSAGRIAFTPNPPFSRPVSLLRRRLDAPHAVPRFAGGGRQNAFFFVVRDPGPRVPEGGL